MTVHAMKKDSSCDISIAPPFLPSSDAPFLIALTLPTVVIF